MYQAIYEKKKSSIMRAMFFLTLLYSFSLFSCTQKPIVRSSFALGAPITIQVFKGGSAKAIDKAFEQAVRIETMMSTSKKDYDTTELLAINAQSQDHAQAQGQNNKGIRKTYSASTEIVDVIKTSLTVSQETNGAFDVTIAPLIRLWGFGEQQQSVPSAKDIIASRKKVNWKTLEVISENTIALQAGQSIDVGGIAKGYAADLAAATLKKLGVSHALIDFGGNIRTVGTRKPNGDMWRIGIQAPFENIGSIIGSVLVEETSVVSSGVYERFFEQDGKKYFHIIDSATGYPANNGLLSVTIITNNGMRADGLSTGVFVLGLERGMALIESTKNTEAIFIDDAKSVYITTGLVDTFQLSSENYRMGSALYK